MEVVVSTMNNDISLYDQMNLQTDAIIVNQGDTFSYKEQQKKKLCRFFSFKEKGVGLSRNNGLMRVQKEICVIADDDMVYVPDYDEIIKRNYRKYPDADMIVFNVRIHEESTVKDVIRKNHRVRKYNALRYGAVSFTFKTRVIRQSNLFFSQLFGGGAPYGSGEDSLFIWTLLNSRKKIYAVNDTIADVYNEGSTWFEGYNEKYFYDKGALFKALSPIFFPVLIVQFVIRKFSTFSNHSFNRVEILRIMYKGAKQFGNRETVRYENECKNV
ncbi:hypothetical protein CBF27_08225 [Vagococcus acidifermentans]|uniref:Glycosyltransferase 2-like domain-containing protein n=1 Tax=Vagococcus acidifermentans TaxID=564710 RepID=A0A430ATZ3_9ENTE|nr:hypothetical protein CBF27_08225 [Vagococcus acidifermentans]